MIEKGAVFTADFDVSTAVQEGFIALFGDKNILHVDGEYAQSKGFKGKVMQGNILNGFLSYFIGEMLPVKNVIIHSQQIKFSKPVYENDTVHFQATAAEVYESVGVVEFKYSFSNEVEKVASGKIQIGFL